MNKKVFIKQDGTIPGHRIIEELWRRGAKNSYGDYSGNIDSNGYYYIYDNQIRLWFLCDSTPDCPFEGYTELLYNKETNSFYENSPILSNSSNTEKNPIELQEWKFDMIDGTLNVLWNIPEGYEAKVEDGKVIVRKKYTIKDAKPGDILVASDGSIFIFASIKENAAAYYFARTACGDASIGNGEGLWEAASACVPATQEEKDLLFQKIDEAGYEWDADKLELKKKKWQPMEEDKVWYISFHPTRCEFMIDYYHYFKNQHLIDANSFQTEEEAQAFCEKLNAVIEDVFEERRKEVE